MPSNLSALTAKLVLLAAVTACLSGCGLIEYRHRKPHITAYPASPGNQCEAPGIPFYLPKPLLVVSKNFYHVEDAKIGLTGSAPIPTGFDGQADFAKLDFTGNFTRTGSSNMKSDDAIASEGNPGGPPEISGVAHSPTLHSTKIPSGPHSTELVNDGLGPHMFFTYEIVFVPDLTQKYSLEINGGAGEVRAAMNLVNGWQFTGLGPYYMKDSSTAQNIMANGVALNLGLGGASDVINSVANLKSRSGGDGTTVGGSEITEMAKALDRARQQETFSIDHLPVDAWGTKTVYAEDGSTAIVRTPPKIENYAEISVYEATLEGGEMVWRPIADHKYDREFLGVLQKKITPMTSIGGNPASATVNGQFIPGEKPVENGDNGAGAAEQEPDAANGAAGAAERTSIEFDSNATHQSYLFQACESRLREQLAGTSSSNRERASRGRMVPYDQVLNRNLEPPGGGGTPIVLQAPAPKPAFSDSDLAEELVRQTLNPPVRPKRSVWDRLRCKPVQSNSVLNGSTID